MGRKAALRDTVGLYQRKKVWWFRQTIDGDRFFQNLRTRDLDEAIKKARSLRGVRPAKKPRTSNWDKAIAKYIEQKKAGVKPAHLAGKRIRSFRDDTTAKKVTSALTVFSKTCGASKPDAVTVRQLQAYYDKRAKTSKSGARSTLALVQAFLEHIHCLPGRVVIPHDHKLETRTAVATIENANGWIEGAPTDRLKFALFCGFHAGMRKGEIMHSRVHWFDLDRGIVTVPGEEKQTLPNGRRFLWKNKDSSTREIPLSAQFVEFLEVFLREPVRDFCLPSIRQSSNRQSKGLYDFRAPFEDFVSKKGRPDLTIHGMRHSWITALANSGNHAITEISAWSGDTLETIERNYWHQKAVKGALDQTMVGQRKIEQDRQQALAVAEILQLIRSGKLSETEGTKRIVELIPNGSALLNSISSVPQMEPEKNEHGQITGFRSK